MPRARAASIAQRESDDYRNDSVRYSHSLNSSQRRRLLSKIAEENYSILSRLQEAKPVRAAALACARHLPAH